MEFDVLLAKLNANSANQLTGLTYGRIKFLFSTYSSRAHTL